MTPDSLQEPTDKLDAPTLDMHRGIAALVEALQQLDHHNQRHDACTDPELRLVLAHHRDRGRRQVAMLLEWMRRRDTRLNQEMREVMFKTGPIAAPFNDEPPVPVRED